MGLCGQLLVFLAVGVATLGAVPRPEPNAAHGELLRARRSAPIMEDRAVESYWYGDAIAEVDNSHVALRGRQKREESVEGLPSKDDEPSTPTKAVKEKVKKVRDWLVKMMHTVFGGGRSSPGDSSDPKQEAALVEGAEGAPQEDKTRMTKSSGEEPK